MVTRKIVHIDEELCNGCGNCIPKCAEGALQIVDGKARIIKETYCDGLGACLGECPQGAIRITEREAEAFDEEEVHRHLQKLRSSDNNAKLNLKRPQWPVKINLLPAKAPFFKGSHLLIAADCGPIAMKDFHTTLMDGRIVMIGCPKFDDARKYVAKLTEILKQNDITDILVARMEVPCCSGLTWAINKSIEASGKNIPLKEQIIAIKGELNE